MTFQKKYSAIAVAAAIIGLPVCAQEMPSAVDIKDYLLIPSFWEIEDLRIVASQMAGTPISPLAQIRFEADVSPNTDLFVETGAADLGPFRTLIASTADNVTRTLYGTMELEYASGNWDGAVNIENPLTQLGAPRDAFSKPTLILGSTEEATIAKLLSENVAAQLAAELAITRQDLEAKGQVERDELMRDHREKLVELSAAFERERADWEVRQASFEAERQTELRNVAADLNAEIEAIEESHDVEMRLLKDTQDAELLRLAADHSARVGETMAIQAQEIAEAETAYTVLLESLNARIATSEEIISKQQMLIENGSIINENEGRLEDIIAANAAQNEAALSDLLGTWRGSVTCFYNNDYVLWEIIFEPSETIGRTVAGTFTNLSYATGEYIGRAVLIVKSESTVPPFPVTLSLTKNAISVMSIDLTIMEDGRIAGESAQTRSNSDEKLCKDFFLVKAVN